MALAPGTLVNPRVRLLRPLGGGAMGSVWVAEHLTLEVEVAVKFIRPELSSEDNQSLIERFRREASAAAKINDPHVVQTFDQGFMADETPYIVMELLEGETLGERLSHGGALSRNEAGLLVTQVCRGLGKAHAIGIVHRDIKPDNLFLVGSGDELLVKILDFGIAKQANLPAGAATASGTLVGTPQYMSPEQLLHGKDVGPSADLWALSVVAYQALLGQPPFEGETVAGIIVAITKAKYRRPSSLDARFKGAVDEWFDRALSLGPEARFTTPRDLAATFRDALAATGRSASAGSNTGRPDSARGDSGQADAAASDPPGDGGGDAATTDGKRGDTLVSANRGDPRQAARGGATAPDGDIAVESAAPSGSSRLWPIMPAAALLAVAVVLGWHATQSADQSPAADGARAPAAARGQPGIAPAGTQATSPATATTGAHVSRTDFRATGVLTLTAGVTPDGATWLPSFRLVRQQSGRNADYLQAQASCRQRRMALCSDAQWQCACNLDTAVGEVATWTATAVADEGFVVRGGAGCNARDVVSPAERSAERDALCCSRAVGIRKGDHRRALLQDASAKLLQVERAFSSGNADLLTALAHDEVRYRSRVMPRAGFVKLASKTFQFASGGWILHDTCDVSRFEQGGEAEWSADCDVVVRQGKKLGYWVRRYTFTLRDGKLRTVEVPKVHRPSSVP